MTPGQYSFNMVRGTTDKFVFRLKQDDGSGNKVPIPFDDVRMSIKISDATTMLLTVSGGELIVTDPAEAEITWEPAPTDTRELPANQPVSYEVEVWFGSTQEVYVAGTITGIGGINDD